MKHYTSFLLLAFATFAFSCRKSEPQASIPNPGQVIPVSVLPLQKGGFSSEIQASGTFTTLDETLLSFKIGGIVSQVLVREGDEIKAGQILASLDLTEIQASLSQAKLGYEKALRDQQRAERLFRDSVATLEQMENAKTALDMAEQQLKTVQFNLNFAQIRAPKNGYVLKKFVNPGQQVSSGAPIVQVNGANSGSWVLKATLSDRDWSQIRVGDPGLIFPANHQIGFAAEVIRKSQAVDPQTGTYWVDLRPNETQGWTLAAGMFGNATISPTSQTDGWQIPYGALLDAQGNTGFVFVSTPENIAKKVPVILGKISPNTVQILSGLETYSHLIVSGSAYLTDGSTIEIQKP